MSFAFFPTWKLCMPSCWLSWLPQLEMPQPAIIVTSQSAPMWKSLYTRSLRPLCSMMTGMCILSFFVPGLMYMSMPGLSVLDTMSMFAVVLRPASCPSERMLYAPSGTP